MQQQFIGYLFDVAMCCVFMAMAVFAANKNAALVLLLFALAFGCSAGSVIFDLTESIRLHSLLRTLQIAFAILAIAFGSITVISRVIGG